MGEESERDQLKGWGEEARRWLEASSKRGTQIVTGGEDEVGALWQGEDGLSNAVGLGGLVVSLTKDGLARCTFRIPSHLTDEEGNWHTGAIAVAMDDVGAAAIVSLHGIIKVSVQFDISYFSSAKFNDEVEMEGRVIPSNGNLTAVVVEARKKPAGALVAIGRQWMSGARGKKINNNSKL